MFVELFIALELQWKVWAGQNMYFDIFGIVSIVYKRS